MKSSVRRMLVWVMLAACFAARGQESEWEIDLLDAVNQGVEEVQSLAGQFPVAAEWNQFWALCRQTLQSESLDDLDWLRPCVEFALPLLRSVPAGQPYADWLQQRLDYFEVAGEVVQAIPSGAPAPKPQPRGGLIPSRPKPRPPPPPVNRSRLSKARSPDTWKAKIASRPKPADAAELVPKLKPIFRNEGIPAELVWLAEVESSFDPAARSPVGAAGLYQFMPATARRFGLQTAPRDERLVPERSATAAARYLKALYKQFRSWPLALAAYNAGEGRVGRLLNASSSKTFEAIQDSLPLETQMYVPKVLATVELREGTDLRSLPGPTVRTGLPVELVLAALGVD